MRTFFTMEGGDSEFANFTLPTLKAFLEARSHNVSGNKNAFFLRTRGLPVSKKTRLRHFFSTLHPLSTVIFATATVLAFGMLRDSTSIVIHNVKQRLLRNRPGSALRPLVTSGAKHYKAHSL